MSSPSLDKLSSSIDAERLTDVQIEQGWRDTFSTNNPFCPCDLETFTKAARWAEANTLRQPRIVQCVNSHDELVAALQELSEAELLDDDDPRLMAARKQAATVLSKATGSAA